MIEIKVGNEYVLNEDLTDLIPLKDGVSLEPIRAGARCKVIEINGEYVTLEFENGRKIRTEDHMID